MQSTTTVHMGRKGVVVIPQHIRKMLGLDAGSLLILEQTDTCVVIRPAMAVTVEKYTDRRKAEFLLNDAFDAKSYADARETVRKMGLDPDTIPHERPDAKDR